MSIKPLKFRRLRRPPQTRRKFNKGQWVFWCGTKVQIKDYWLEGKGKKQGYRYAIWWNDNLWSVPEVVLIPI